MADNAPQQAEAWGMLRVEGDEMAFRFYGVMLRQLRRLVWLRARFVWKVLRGRYELTDAMHNLAVNRATSALWAAVKAGHRLRAVRWRGATGAEVDVLRLKFQAAAKSFTERCETNDFYQDSNSLLGTHIRYRKGMTRVQ